MGRDLVVVADRRAAREVVKTVPTVPPVPVPLPSLPDPQTALDRYFDQLAHITTVGGGPRLRTWREKGREVRANWSRSGGPGRFFVILFDQVFLQGDGTPISGPTPRPVPFGRFALSFPLYGRPGVRLVLYGRFDPSPSFSHPQNGAGGRIGWDGPAVVP